MLQTMELKVYEKNKKEIHLTKDEVEEDLQPKNAYKYLKSCLCT